MDNKKVISDKQLFAFTQFHADVMEATANEHTFKVSLGTYFCIHPDKTGELLQRCINLGYVEKAENGTITIKTV